MIRRIEAPGPKTLLRQALSCIIWKLPYLTKFRGLVGPAESENPFGQTRCWPDEVHRLDDFALSHDDLSCHTQSRNALCNML